MAKQKVEIDLDVPDGLEFVRYGRPKAGELYLHVGCAYTSELDLKCDYFIVREAWQWPAWLKADYIAMDKGGDWYAFKNRPDMKSGEWYSDRQLMFLDLSLLDFTPPSCTDWKQSLRAMPGVLL